MIIYLKKVRELLKNFVWVQVKYVPRAQNSQANALTKLATTSQEHLEMSSTSWSLDKHQQRRDFPSDDCAELDGPHLGLLVKWDIAK